MYSEGQNSAGNKRYLFGLDFKGSHTFGVTDKVFSVFMPASLMLRCRVQVWETH